MYLQKPNSRVVQQTGFIEPKKQRRKSRWFYPDTAREDELEIKRLKSDPDYRAIKNVRFSKLF